MAYYDNDFKQWQDTGQLNWGFLFNKNRQPKQDENDKPADVTKKQKTKYVQLSSNVMAALPLQYHKPLILILCCTIFKHLSLRVPVTFTLHKKLGIQSSLLTLYLIFMTNTTSENIVTTNLYIPHSFPLIIVKFRLDTELQFDS